MGGDLKRALLGLALAGLLLAGCAASPGAPELGTIFPASGAVAGWSAAQAVKTYDRKHLFELVDGQAEAFFAFGFEQAAVQRYTNAQGNQLNVEAWQLASTDDACGLFLSNQSGQAAQLGSESALKSGRRLSFWQARYYIAITANQSLPDETLLAFGAALSKALPDGGERPAILKRLPADGLVAGSAIFFREEISIQNLVWLGGNNLLGLSQKTGGAAGTYQLQGQAYSLLVVQYPDSGGASGALRQLEQARPEGYTAARTNGSLLATVFGPPEAQAVQALLDAALR